MVHNAEKSPAALRTDPTDETEALELDMREMFMPLTEVAQPRSMTVSDMSSKDRATRSTMQTQNYLHSWNNTTHIDGCKIVHD